MIEFYSKYEEDDEILEDEEEDESKKPKPKKDSGDDDIFGSDSESKQENSGRHDGNKNKVNDEDNIFDCGDDEKPDLKSLKNTTPASRL